MKVFNTLSNQIEDLKVNQEQPITIYSCGPTVYDYSHVGHARNAIAWDVLVRYLRHKGHNVYWIRNITNVDDKIINRAKELQLHPERLARQYTYEFWQDMTSLNITWPDAEPRATDYIPMMINCIEQLLDKGFAYTKDGDVYFRVTKYSQYGQLKKQDLNTLQKGLSRIDVNDKKENPLDFALWKTFSNEEYTFSSPWGFGRPGWHLECSAMIKSILEDKFQTNTLDIHSGGDDLIFPHHENGCAQSTAINNCPLARYWLHNGMVMINGSKMSKSENNFLTIRDALAQYNANALRYFCLTTHYSKQINFTHESLMSAQAGFNKLVQEINNNQDTSELDQNLIEKFNSFMDEDLATPRALALLFGHTNQPTTIKYLLSVLGFDLNKATNNTNSQTVLALNATVNLLLELRSDARKSKNFALSDNIRDKLINAGITLNDNRNGDTDWSLTEC